MGEERPALPSSSEKYRTLLETHAAIEFDEVKHEYRYRGSTINASVSALVKKVFPFDRDAVLTRMVSSTGWKRSKYYNTCGKDAVTGARIEDDQVVKQNIARVWKAKVDLGKQVHAALEAKFEPSVVVRGNGSPQTAAAMMTPAKRKHYDDCLYCLELLNVSEVVDLFTKYRWRTLKTECRLVDESRSLAGTADLLLVDDNDNLVIVDWKVSTMRFEGYYNNKNETATPPMHYYPRSNYWQYAMQLNLYKAILNQVYDLHVSHAALVCFDDNYKMKVHFVPFIKDVELWYANYPQNQQ